MAERTEAATAAEVIEAIGGAKGRCYWCGRPEGENKGGVCPELQERSDQKDRSPRHFLPGDHYAVGLVR